MAGGPTGLAAILSDMRGDFLHLGTEMTLSAPQGKKAKCLHFAISVVVSLCAGSFHLGCPPCAYTDITVSMDAPEAAIKCRSEVGCKLFWVYVVGRPTGLAAILSDMRGDFLL